MMRATMAASDTAGCQGGVVGVLTTSYPRWPGDHAGAFVADRVDELVRAGHRVVVLAAAASGEGGGLRTAVQREADSAAAVQVFRVPAAAGARSALFYDGGAPEAFERGAPSALGDALVFASGMAREVMRRASGWTRVESHWLAPCALMAAACAPRLPHRAYAHSGDVWLLEKIPLGDALARHLAACGADLVFVTEALRTRFAALAGRQVGSVAPILPNPALFHPARPDERSAARRTLGVAQPLILSVGRLVPIKGFDLLVRAAAELSHREPRPLVTILGEGIERGRLQALARRLGVRLRLPGALSRRDVAVWMRAADVYVQPSRPLANGRTEGLPVAALEAVLTGLPVVAAETGGLPELHRHRASAEVRLFPAGSARLMAARLARYVNPA